MACDSTPTSVASGFIRFYGNPPSNCGWVIEVVQTNGSIKVYKPLELDTQLQADNLYINFEYTSFGPSTCNNGPWSVNVEEIGLVQIL